jgi:hypothetical protein
MKIIQLPVNLKDKADRYVESELKCEILSRGSTWILTND